MIKDEPGRYYQSRIVWLKKQKRLAMCGYACDGKCSVTFGWKLNKTDIFWDKNLIALSPQMPYWIIRLLVYKKLRN